MVTSIQNQFAENHGFLYPVTGSHYISLFNKRPAETILTKAGKPMFQGRQEWPHNHKMYLRVLMQGAGTASWLITYEVVPGARKGWGM